MTGLPVQRVAKRRVDGVLLLDKPEGISSNAALQQCKRLFRAVKAGHTGTLDPLATGLLPICFGEATKFAGYSLAASKTYRAELALGVRTTTGDREGTVLATRPVDFDDQRLAAVLGKFAGTLTQTAPIYSALKHEGRPLYEYARAGVAVSAKEREVTILSLRLLNRTHTHVTLEIACTKGTYVRTLAEQIGEALGCGAHLSALRRLKVGDFDLAAAISFEELEAIELAERDRRLLSADSPTLAFAPLYLTPAQALDLFRGRTLAADAGEACAGDLVRLYCAAQFIGIGRLGMGGKLVAERLVRQVEQADFAK